MALQRRPQAGRWSGPLDFLQFLWLLFQPHQALAEMASDGIDAAQVAMPMRIPVTMPPVDGSPGAAVHHEVDRQAE